MATDIRSYPPIRTRPEFADILRRDERYAVEPSEELSSKIDSWFDRLMIQSGLAIAPSAMLLLCVVSAVVLAGLIFVVQENVIGAVLGGIIGGFIPIVVAIVARSRRQKTLMEQMPAMIEELARAARTGRSLEQSFQLVASDTPSPLGDELELASRKLNMSLSMREALRDLPERTGLVSLSVFKMALVTHQETGGDLVHVLERLSRTIRDRMLYLGRLRAATTASRLTGLLMIAIPPIFLIAIMLWDPTFLQRLSNNAWGRMTIFVAITLQIIGSIWMIRILRDSQKT